MLIVEDKRTQLLSTSKTAKKENDGKTRYQKRVKSKVKANVSNLNKVDFNKLFKENIMTVNLDVYATWPAGRFTKGNLNLDSTSIVWKGVEQELLSTELSLIHI